MNLIGEYMNGNVHTKIYEDGTKVRETEDDDFRPAFAENMDVKITDRCTGTNCAFCHEGSSPQGKQSDILNEKFIDSLHPFTECALGGGSVFEYPDFIPLLERLKEKQVIPNITVNQIHFLQNYDKIKALTEKRLVYGVGVSLVNPTMEFIEKVQSLPNAVVHTIVGILNPWQMEKLARHDLKVLLLGYKELRRGVSFKVENERSIAANTFFLESNLKWFLNSVKVLSFDNLALDQLHVKEKLSPEAWEQFYGGDDGTFTFYIDTVNRQFARSSTAPMDKRYPLLDNVDDMFNVIRKETIE